MKLTKTLVRHFEQEQEAHGTEVALYNLLWRKASDDLKAIGVRGLHTTTRPARTREATR